MKEYIHICKGTCSRQVTITYDENTHIIEDVKFLYGCPGNLNGISRLCKGRKLEEVRNTLLGVRCGNKPTSCPNELALGIGEILKNN